MLRSFIGEQDNKIKYFLNTGSTTSPVYVLQTGAANPFNGVGEASNAAPWCGDVDGDGDVDWYGAFGG